ncbi:MAG: hypothetical protein ACPG7F_02260 [Aggregatilineales bacterium]
MRFDRTTIIFIIFALLIGGFFGYQQFVKNTPAQIFTVAVNPLAETWAKAAADAYNASNPLVDNTQRVQVEIIVVDDLDVWQDRSGWTINDHPAGWLAGSSLSVDYLSQRTPYTTLVNSTAQTPLVWGGFADRVDLLTADGAAFDWDAVQAAATAQTWRNFGSGTINGNINIAINWATGSMAGVGALLSSAAAYDDTSAVTVDLTSSAEFREWFQPINDSIFNSQRLGDNPARTMSQRGASAADMGLLPEVQWLETLTALNGRGEMTFAYPAYQFSLDFPMTAWQGGGSESWHRGAVQSFANFLRGERGQALAIETGLRPVSGRIDSTASLFVAGQAAGIGLIDVPGTVLDAPAKNVVERLLALINS